MDRREFIRDGGLFGLGLLFFPKTVLAKPKYPLTSVPDTGTVLDVKRSARAREMADNVLYRVPREGLIKQHKTDESDSERCTVELQFGGWKYILTAYNQNEEKGRRPDSIKFWMSRLDSPGIMILSDNGLDGLCDSGSISPGIVSNERELTLHLDSGVGLDNRKTFQDLYDNSLDRLLIFYDTNS